MRTIAACVLFLTMAAHTASAQARAVVNNNSGRDMAVKVMALDGSFQSLFARTSISAHGAETVYFDRTGIYYLKTMATAPGRKPVYKMGEPFRVYVGSDGYSVITFTFTIVESAGPSGDGKEITPQEFERDSGSR